MGWAFHCFGYYCIYLSHFLSANNQLQRLAPVFVDLRLGRYSPGRFLLDDRPYGVSNGFIVFVTPSRSDHLALAGVNTAYADAATAFWGDLMQCGNSLVDGKLQLASTSPRRAELLSQIGVCFDKVAINVDESRQASETVHQFVARLAEDKAKAGYRLSPLGPTLGADTIVVCREEVLGKPKDRDDGLRMLGMLSGAWHQVWTSAAIFDGKRLKSCVVETQVRFRELSQTEKEAYWHTGEPLDKAGAYGIQGKAAVFVEELKGSYSAVVGLPLCETASLLAEFGLAVWAD